MAKTKARQSILLSLLIALLLVVPVTAASQYRVDHIVWLVGDWDHRNRNSGMYEYLRTKLQETFLHDGCMNDGADTLNVHEFYYDPLKEITTASGSNTPEAVEFCQAFRNSLPLPGTNAYTVTVVGMGTGVAFAKNAFVEFGGTGGPCELPHIDTLQIRINYLWIDSPPGFNDEPSILHPHTRWDPYRANAAGSSEMQNLSQSMRIYGAQVCEPNGPPNEAGCGYEFREESPMSAYNPFLGYAPPGVGASFANPSRRELRKDILLDINYSWYSQFGNVIQTNCRCPSNAAYWNSHHMLICWCDGHIDYVGGMPVCTPFQLPLEWTLDPDSFLDSQILNDPSFSDYFDNLEFEPPELPPSTPDCGDGDIDLGEDCDDGNTANGDGCTADCTKEKCGDGIVQKKLKEECEPSNGEEICICNWLGMHKVKCGLDCKIPGCDHPADPTPTPTSTPF